MHSHRNLELKGIGVSSGVVVGPVLLLPTASKKELGSEKWGLGPTAVGHVQGVLVLRVVALILRGHHADEDELPGGIDQADVVVRAQEAERPAVHPFPDAVRVHEHTFGVRVQGAPHRGCGVAP